MNPMTATDNQPLFTRFCDWIKVRMQRDAELTSLTKADLGAMAADLGMTEADLMDVLPRTADHSGLMDRMMEARGLDPDHVRRACAGLVRDMELVCSRCRSAALCQHDLALGTAAMNGHEYCGNSHTFTELTAGAGAAGLPVGQRTAYPPA